MKLLLLGSAGQLGQAFVHQPQWSSWQSLALNRGQLNLCDALAVSQILSHYRPDIVINCAAYTAVDRAEQQAAACMAMNAQAVQHLAQQCQYQDALLVHFSTDYVFDGTKGSPYQETDATAALNVYGHSKLLGEQAIQGYCQKHLIFRTSWLFSEFGHNFYSTMLTLAQQGKPIRVVNDQLGCPTYAGDIAATVLQLLQRYQSGQQLPYGLYHLAGSPAVSWYQFASAIFASHNIASAITPVSCNDWKHAARRPLNSALDSHRSQQVLGAAVLNWQAALDKLAAQQDAL